MVGWWLEGSWKLVGGWLDDGWRVVGGLLEGGWRMIGGWLEGGRRVVGRWLEDGWRLVGGWLEGRCKRAVCTGPNAPHLIQNAQRSFSPRLSAQLHSIKTRRGCSLESITSPFQKNPALAHPCILVAYMHPCKDLHFSNVRGARDSILAHHNVPAAHARLQALNTLQHY